MPLVILIEIRLLLWGCSGPIALAKPGFLLITPENLVLGVWDSKVSSSIGRRLPLLCRGLEPGEVGMTYFQRSGAQANRKALTILDNPWTWQYWETHGPPPPCFKALWRLIQCLDRTYGGRVDV
jgi:hypothetical protein